GAARGAADFGEDFLDCPRSGGWSRMAAHFAVVAAPKQQKSSCVLLCYNITIAGRIGKGRLALSWTGVALVPGIGPAQRLRLSPCDCRINATARINRSGPACGKLLWRCAPAAAS